MSREALSLDISRLVSRVVSGEAIDTAERGAALAAKYPELGMTAELIGQAIDRAAGMVGMIRSAPAPEKAVREAANSVAASHVEVAEMERPKPAPAVSTPAPVIPPVALGIDDELAAAIDAEIGNLVTDRRTAPPEPSFADRPVLGADMAGVRRRQRRPILSEPKGPFASLRRALFRR